MLEALGRPDWLAYIYGQTRLLFLPWELVREVVRHRGTAAHAFVLRDAYRLLPKDWIFPDPLEINGTAWCLLKWAA